MSTTDSKQKASAALKKTDKSTFVNPTPEGDKKDMEKIPMADAYTPMAVEAGWYSWWEKQGYFKADNAITDPEKNFVIMIPPPNVTGTLHLGHTLTCSIQDTIVRWYRRAPSPEQTNKQTKKQKKSYYFIPFVFTLLHQSNK